MNRCGYRVLMTVFLTGALGTAVAAAQVESLYGDMDGFGFGAPQDVAGALFVDGFGGEYFTDYREADDLANAPETDYWETGDAVDGPWTHNYVLDFTPTAATLRIYIAGFATTGAVNLLVDNDILATYDFPGENQTTHVLDIPVPLSYIDGSTTFQFDADSADGYIWDYAKLTVLPEPATAVLLALGLLALRRR